VSLNVQDQRIAAVAQLWSAHREMPFPGRLRSVDVAGVEMVTLDADVAGCVSVWLSNGGGIDRRRWDILAARTRQLELVVLQLTEQEATYCRRLLDMAVLVLEAPADPTPG
jgi:hypothetical protein